MFNFLHRHLYLIISILLMIFAFSMYWGIVGNFKLWEFSTSGKDWADFGSYAGGIFAALAFLVVVYQNYQRDKEQKKQDFEKTFFMMLEQHNEKLHLLESKNIIEDKETNLVNFLYIRIMDGQLDFNKVRSEFETKYEVYYSEINVYFLNLYRVLKFIYKNKHLNVDNEYSSLLRSFLSRKILIILAYHLCGRDKTYDEYIRYINEFHFLEHMDIESLELGFVSSFFKKEIHNIQSFFPLLNREFDINTYNDIKYLFRIVGDYNKVKDHFYYNCFIKLCSSKRNLRPISAENVFVKKNNFHKYSPIPLFIYVISVFDKAFIGNLSYTYIKAPYKEICFKLKRSLKR